MRGEAAKARKRRGNEVVFVRAAGCSGYSRMQPRTVVQLADVEGTSRARRTVTRGTLARGGGEEAEAVWKHSRISMEAIEPNRNDE